MRKSAITKLLYGQLRCQDLLLKFASGKMVSLKDLDTKEEIHKSYLSFKADLEEYVAKFVFQEVEEKVISCKTILTPKGKVKDKIRTITSLQGFYKAKEDALFIAHDFIDVGIKERNKRKKERFSEYVTSIFSKNRTKSAITFTTKFPSKFYSRVDYKQRKDGIIFSLNTIIPLSYEGRLESEEWFVFADMPTTKALEWTANRLEYMGLLFYFCNRRRR